MRDGHCPKCKHNRILHVREVADSEGSNERPRIGETAPSFNESFNVPLRVARVENPDRGFLNHMDAAVGIVEAFVCRRCGFTELYTREPDRIPIDGKQVREIVGAETEGPYR